MARFVGIRRTLRILARRRTVEQDLRDELEFHLATREEELRRDGLAAPEARARARREFGDPEAARRELAGWARGTARRRDRADWVSEVGHDLRVAFRRLAREPGYLVAAALTLALGIGANLGIAAVGRAVLVHPLPYPDADRLVFLWETKGGDRNDRSEASFPDYLDLARGADPALIGLEAFDPGNATATVDGRADRVRVTSVTAGFLDLLGAPRILGRSFARDEDGPGGTPVAILSHRYWAGAYGADPGVVGRAVLLDGRPYTVIGVLGSGFHFALGGDPDVWVPLDASAGRRAERFNHWVRPVGRLAAGVTRGALQARLAGVMERLAGQYPETNAGRGVLVTALRDEVIGGIRPIVLGLAAALALVLLIVCANLASLTLARGLSRARELAVRVALGASRSRIARLLLTESLVVALLGAAIGAALAGPAVRLVLGLVPEGTRNTLPFLDDTRLAPAIMGYGAALAVITGLAFGAAPLLALRRLGHDPLAASGARLVGAGRGRLRAALVVGQIGLTTALLVGAGLLTRSLLGLLAEDPGFRTEGILTARVALDAPRFADPSLRTRYLESLLDEVKRLPTVRSVGAVSGLPLNGGSTNTFKVEGAPEPDPANRLEANMRGVLGDYFQTLGVPLLEGRRLAPDDDRQGAPVLLVNRSLAARLAPSGTVVGRRIRFYAFPARTWEVVGVVGDVKTGALDAPVPPTIYYSAITGGENRMSLVIGTAGRPTDLIPAVQARLTELAPDVPGYQVVSLAEYVARSPAVLGRRLTLAVVGAFAGLALALAVVGLYGALAFQVAERRRELGLRLALGATGGRVMAVVLRRGIRLAGLGLVLGLALALLGGRAVRGLLYGIHPADPLTLALVSVILAGVTLASCWLPARRAARVDPIETLRDD